MQSFAQFLVEMPQHYPGKVTYQKDGKFIPISSRNAHEFKVLGDDGDFVFTLDTSGNAGYIFLLKDFSGDAQHIVPVLRVLLRDSGIEDYKQAHSLRIRESFAKNNLTTHWYLLYIEKVGPIVSDTEHLEGGYILWKSFLKMSKSGKVKLSIYDREKKEETPVINQSEEDIWKQDSSGKNIVLIMRK